MEKKSNERRPKNTCEHLKAMVKKSVLKKVEIK